MFESVGVDASDSCGSGYAGRKMTGVVNVVVIGESSLLSMLIVALSGRFSGVQGRASRCCEKQWRVFCNGDGRGWEQGAFIKTGIEINKKFYVDPTARH